MQPIKLTEGAIKMIVRGKEPKNMEPVLQVTDISFSKMENLKSYGGTFWIWLSDGSFSLQMMLGIYSKHFVGTGKLQKGSIVMLRQFRRQMIDNLLVIEIIDLDVIHKIYDFIGKPKPYPTKTNWYVPRLVSETAIGLILKRFSSKNVPAPISVSWEMDLDERYVHKTIKQIEDEKLGMSEEPDLIAVRARITFIGTKEFCYTTCPNMTGDRRCKGWLTENSDGGWRCYKCNQVVYNCDYHYSLSIKIQDDTGSTWLTVCGDNGEKIMGISAKDLYMVKQDAEKFFKRIKDALFAEFVFKLKVKEVKNDEVGWEIHLKVVKVEKVTETTYLVEETANSRVQDSGSIRPKYEPAVNYVNTPREAGASASHCGVIVCDKCDGSHQMGPKFSV